MKNIGDENKKRSRVRQRPQEKFHLSDAKSVSKASKGRHAIHGSILVRMVWVVEQGFGPGGERKKMEALLFLRFFA